MSQARRLWTKARQPTGEHWVISVRTPHDACWLSIDIMLTAPCVVRKKFQTVAFLSSLGRAARQRLAEQAILLPDARRKAACILRPTLLSGVSGRRIALSAHQNVKATRESAKRELI